ncbi:hypothetical protein M885DRAFT_611044 [Pelagophyceae sp. CCMP2097]|nr:hypothetical protein M885DRAFT_611044 [Pelagophyceae sp. CCMP2097]
MDVDSDDESLHLMAVMRSLADLDDVLTREIDAARPVVDACRSRCTVSDDEILRYAYRLRHTTAAPAEWSPEHPMVGFLPPAPQPEIMRSGALGTATALCHAR